MKITVLMSTYNGAKYLEPQLESLLNQTIAKDMDVLIRDDGSNDGTQEILDKYQKEHKNIKWYQGENLKPAKSFWDLLTKASGSDFYAFCDQDDVWDVDKLEAAVKHLQEKDQSNPLLYFCDVRIVDEELNIKRDSMVPSDIPIDYPRSLLNNIAPGCSYVFNEKARELAAQFDPNKYFLDIHDWQMYRICSCFGECIFDHTAHMSYRQHGGNTIGAVKNRLMFYINIIKKGNSPEFVRKRYRIARALEECYGEQMSEDNKYLTHLLAHYVEDKACKKALLKEPRFKYSRGQYLYFKHRIRVGKF